MLENCWFEFVLVSQLGFGAALIDISNASTLAFSTWVIYWNRLCLMYCLRMAKAPFFDFWRHQPLTWKYVFNWKNLNRLAFSTDWISSPSIIITFSLITIWVLRIAGLKVWILRSSALQVFIYLGGFQLWRITIVLIFCFCPGIRFNHNFCFMFHWFYVTIWVLYKSNLSSPVRYRRKFNFFNYCLLWYGLRGQQDHHINVTCRLSWMFCGTCKYARWIVVVAYVVLKGM